MKAFSHAASDVHSTEWIEFAGVLRPSSFPVHDVYVHYPASLNVGDFPKTVDWTDDGDVRPLDDGDFDFPNSENEDSDRQYDYGGD